MPEVHAHPAPPPAEVAAGSWKSQLAASGLPAPLAALVSDTVRRAAGLGGWALLWPSERAELARELISHFRDGLAAGQTPDALAAAFGDPRTAARLMARAKRRNRPAWARAIALGLRVSAVALALLVAAYAYLGARFYLARPNITRNYVAELNKPVLATPVEQRAWPLLIEAARVFGPDPEPVMTHGWPERPADPAWAFALAHIQSHPEGLALLRRAAAAPVLGYVYRGTADPDLMKALESRSPNYKYTPEPGGEPENPLLIGILLPHLGEMRRGARLLRIDAIDAAAAGDRERFMADVEAVLGLARHAWSEQFFISQLVGLAIAELAADVVRAHALTPGLLEDDDLTKLAHGLGDFAGRPVRFDFAAERHLIDDFAQRFFTDDGHGGGTLVYRHMPQTFREFGAPDPSDKFLARALLPVVAAATYSRADLTRQADRIVRAFEHDQALPLWRRTERTGDVERAALLRIAERTFPIFASLASGVSAGSSFISRDLFEMRRDATLTVLAVEKFRRERGRLPTSLDELVPRFLPSLPIDGADGRPLRYRPRPDGPLLYSLGADGDDDGGRPPAKGHRHAARFTPDTATPGQADLPTDPAVLAEIDGDLILFPPPPEPAPTP